MGRPSTGKYDSFARKLNKYIKDCRAEEKLPILKEFCLERGFDYEYVYALARKHPDSELAQSIKKCVGYKEVDLERGGLTGKYDRTMAVFSLKQLGWTDKPKKEQPEGEVKDNWTIPISDITSDYVECVNWFLNGWFHDHPEERKDKTRNVDYDVDQWRIYADFLQVYGIDLSSTDMHWWKFCGLLWNMPYRQSAFQQVVYARTAVPDRNSGAEERKRIRENKKKYALEQLNEPKEYTAEEKSAIDAYDRMMAERRK